VKAAALAKAAEKEAERIKAAEEVKAAAEAKTVAEKNAKEEKLAALAPSAAPPDHAPAADLPRSLQSELKRVGCNTGSIDGNWNASSQRALDLFNKHAGTKLDVKVANGDALDAVKGKSSRVCPLICDQGFRADGERCVRIACRVGYRVNSDNECEKIEDKKPVATREETKTKRDTERKQVESAPSKPQASGQVFCTSQSCRPVQKGCRLVQTGRSSMGSGGVEEVCR
jgi:hypothetical protein